jgi:hypothetical protein
MSLGRRQFLARILKGAASASLLASGGLGCFGGATDEGLVGDDADDGGGKADSGDGGIRPVEIENWARTVVARARRVEVPGDLAELQAAVRRAHAAGRHVRAFGSAWSFTSVFGTSDVGISPERLTGVIDVAKGPTYDSALGRALRPEVRGGRAYAYIKSGEVLRSALARLESEGLAIATMGSSAGQRVGGLLATSSHGGDFDMPPPVDYVRAVHLVRADGSSVWLEGTGSRAITQAAGAAQVAGIDPRDVIYDDVLFDAARVSIGSLGVVYGLVLEVVPMVYQREYFAALPWTTVRAGLASGDIFVTPPIGATELVGGERSTYRYLEVLVNPYPKAGVVEVGVVTRFGSRTGTASSWTRPSPPVTLADQLRVLSTVIGRDDDEFAEVIDQLQSGNRADSDVYAPSPDICDTGGDQRVPVQSLELAISTRNGRHMQLLDRLLEIFETGRRAGRDFAGFWTIRTTQMTQAPLAMQTRESADRTGDRIVHIEIAGLQELDLSRPNLANPHELEVHNASFFDAFLEAGRSLGARPHWGQWATSRLPHSITSYERGDAWLDAKRRLAPDDGSHFTFDNDFSARAGLAPLDPGWSVTGAIPTTPSRAPEDARPVALSAPTLCLTGSQAVAAAASGDGRLGVSLVGAPWMASETTGTPVIAGRVAATADRSGRVVITARLDDGTIHFAKLEGTTLSPLRVLEGRQRFTQSPVSVLDADGAIRVYALDRGGEIHVRRFETDGDWDGGWSALRVTGGARGVAPLSATLDAAGRINLFVRARGEVVALRARSSARDAEFEPANLGLDGVGDVASASTAGATLAASVVGDRVRTSVRRASESLFREETPPLPAVLAGTSPDVLAVGDYLVVAVTDTSRNVVLATRDPAGGWTVRPPIAAHASGSPALALVGSSIAIATRLAHDLVQTYSLQLGH